MTNTKVKLFTFDNTFEGEIPDHKDTGVRADNIELVDVKLPAQVIANTLRAIGWTCTPPEEGAE